MSLASEYPLRPGGHAEILFDFDRIVLRGEGLRIANFTLKGVEPNTRRERALIKLRQPPDADGLTDWQVFKVRLPPRDPVSLYGRAWRDLEPECIPNTSGGASDEPRESSETLKLNWRKLVSTYLSKSNDGCKSSCKAKRT